MVKELQELLRANVAEAPPDDADLATVVRQGRARVRRRRAGVAAGAAGLAVAVVAVTTLATQLPGRPGEDVSAAGSAPVGPVLRLDDAVTAEPDVDYRLLATHTNVDLDHENGQYFDGVTTDGKILYTDGPHGIDPARMALMDLLTGEKDWLPAPPAQPSQQLALGADRLVFLGQPRGDGALTALVFDRGSREWSRIAWAGLPGDELRGAQLAPDGRLYVGVSTAQETSPRTESLAPAEQGDSSDDGPGNPDGNPDGDVDDSGAVGEQFELWSASLTDPADVVDEGIRVGDFRVTEDSLVWTDVTNGVNHAVHVRDLGSGSETSFDPHSGDRCNQLGLGVAAGRVVLTQYCGDTDQGRDDRVQVVTMYGDPVVTVQDDGLDGGVDAGGLIQIDGYGAEHGGTYIYDLDSERFLRLSSASSKFAMGGQVPAGYLLWQEPVNDGHGAVQKLARLLR
ncbi:MAG TPA: hypothetical protein VGJ41_17115 [Nocardioides sp.]|jgi:hypothetical protein